MAKYYLLPYSDGEAIMGVEVIKRYDHDADNTLCIIEQNKCKQMASKAGLSWLLKGKTPITQAEREAYVRSWYPPTDEEDI